MAHRPASPAQQITVADALGGCAEGRVLISRRAAVGITAGLFSSAFLPRLASAASADPRLLVVVLRGGVDGINVVVPHGDPAYQSMRGAIAIQRGSTIPLNSFYGLNPALSAFGAMYARGEALAVHAICTPLRTRSHFETQDNLESGLPGVASNPTGWLNRLLNVMPTGSPINAYGAVQVAEAPLLLRGPGRVLGWAPSGIAHATSDITGAVVRLLASGDRELYDALQAGRRGNIIAEGGGADEAGATPLVRAFRGAGRLLSARNGPRIAVLSVGNFDTHVDQGTNDGFLFGSLRQLDIGLAEFTRLTTTVWRDTVVLMVTEFGRTVRINGGRGTDHGVGTVALLAGGAVAGRRVLGDWPGIGASQLFEGSDLRATTDLRALFKAVLAEHVGVPRATLDRTIFPGSVAVAPMRGVIRASATAANAANVADAAPSGSAPDPVIRPPSAIARYRMNHPI